MADASAEIVTNLVAPLELSAMLIPHLDGAERLRDKREDLFGDMNG